MLEGVHVSPRRIIADPRGDVLHMLKSTDDVFTQFGEVYFSKIQPRQEKAWRRTARQLLSWLYRSDPCTSCYSMIEMAARRMVGEVM